MAKEASRGGDAEGGIQMKRPAAQRRAMLRKTGPAEIERLVAAYESCKDVPDYNSRARRFIEVLNATGEAVERGHLLKIVGLCFIMRDKKIEISRIETNLFSYIYQDPKINEDDRNTLRHFARAFGSDSMTIETLPLFRQFRRQE